MRRRAASPDPVVRETLQRHSATAADSLLATVELRRRDVARGLDPQRRALMGQFLTPAPVAAFMADMVETTKPALHILDPGAGVGSLSAAVVASMCRRPRRPDSIALTAYEIDNTLIGYLRSTLDQCEAACDAVGIEFKARVVNGDFLEAGASTVSGNLFSSGIDEQFDWAILNPPYRKIRSASPERSLLRAIGIETSNLYTGFLGLVSRLLVPGGQMVAITPRSFCNGPYFEPFRRFLLRDMRFRRIHVFDTRNRAFTDDDVLQENVIFRAQRTRGDTGAVVVSSSRDPNDSAVRIRTIKYDDLIHQGDPHSFIHIVTDGDGDTVRQHMMQLGTSLSDLGLTVSTGRVVDFRARDLLRTQPGRKTVPLIYPCHIRNGFVDWPSHQTRKPNALAVGDRADELLVPAGHYVLVKRFSSKEERRRIVAAVYDPDRVRADRVAFENHVNYYHLRGQGLPPTVAKGLVAFLNSTLVDSYFRQFSGHTQVNATDLRSFRYPTRERLVALGRRFGMVFPAQQELDRIVEDVVLRG